MSEPTNLKRTFDANAPLPALTCQQIFILDALGCSEIKGTEFRNLLHERGLEMSDSSFSEATRRLQKHSLIEGRFEKAIVDGHTVRWKHFKITEAGLDALWSARHFFEGLRWQALSGEPSP